MGKRITGIIKAFMLAVLAGSGMVQASCYRDTVCGRTGHR